MRFLLCTGIILVILKELHGHGMVLDPVNRSSAGKAKFNVSINWNDNGINCGGYGVQHRRNEGKCGVCGDNYSLKRPRPNENGGTYGAGVIVKRYRSAENITVKVYISANHRGKFYFSLCPLQNEKELETEECFDQHPVKLANGLDYYPLNQGLGGDIAVELKLPEDLVKCDHCVFRWHWITGNNWGPCGNGTGALGCGKQEEFRTCSDIALY